MDCGAGEIHARAPKIIIAQSLASRLLLQLSKIGKERWTVSFLSRHNLMYHFVCSEVVSAA